MPEGRWSLFGRRSYCGASCPRPQVVDGPDGFVGEGGNDPAQREPIVRAARAVVQEPSLLELNSHLFAVGRKEGGTGSRPYRGHFEWLLGCRRLGLRHERQAKLLQGLLHLACTLVGARFLQSAARP